MVQHLCPLALAAHASPSGPSAGVDQPHSFTSPPHQAKLNLVDAGLFPLHEGPPGEEAAVDLPSNCVVRPLLCPALGGGKHHHASALPACSCAAASCTARLPSPCSQG